MDRELHNMKMELNTTVTRLQDQRDKNGQLEADILIYQYAMNMIAKELNLQESKFKQHDPSTIVSHIQKLKHNYQTVVQENTELQQKMRTVKKTHNHTINDYTKKIQSLKENQNHIVNDYTNKIISLKMGQDNVIDDYTNQIESLKKIQNNIINDYTNKIVSLKMG
ncbi:hypothetical protein HDV02_000377 [Globomyces sp. JEL0801]|nr:hypothetical protein HDV02_000377 [Globomyces sp. JEL0801]